MKRFSCLDISYDTKKSENISWISSRHPEVNFVSSKGLTSHKLEGLLLRILIFTALTKMSSDHPIMSYLQTFWCHMNVESAIHTYIYIYIFLDTLYSELISFRLLTKLCRRNSWSEFCKRKSWREGINFKLFLIAVSKTMKNMLGLKKLVSP